MCGRFVQAQPPQAYADHFGASLAVTESRQPSWNVAPTDQVYAVVQRDQARVLGSFQWGLVPWFADSPKVGARHINARAETVATKAAFKHSFLERRCIVPADGFYEWERKEAGGKLPHYVHAADGKPLALAGLWSTWRGPQGQRLSTCTIITTDPNELVAPIHDRMPVMLPEEHWERWLGADPAEAESLRPLLAPPPSQALVEYPVSTLVNDVRNNYPECIAPLR